MRRLRWGAHPLDGSWNSNLGNNSVLHVHTSTIYAVVCNVRGHSPLVRTQSQLALLLLALRNERAFRYLRWLALTLESFEGAILLSNLASQPRRQILCQPWPACYAPVLLSNWVVAQVMLNGLKEIDTIQASINDTLTCIATISSEAHKNYNKIVGSHLTFGHSAACAGGGRPTHSTSPAKRVIMKKPMNNCKNRAQISL